MKINRHLILLFIVLIGLFGAINVFAATYTYDKLNRLKTVTYDNGKVVTYIYDKAGNILSTTVTVRQ